MAAQQRADSALAAIGVGVPGLAIDLFGNATPFGWGAIGPFVRLPVAAGAALSEANRVRCDAFTGAALVVVLVFRNLPVAIHASISGLAQIDRSLEVPWRRSSAARASRR